MPVIVANVSGFQQGYQGIGISSHSLVVPFAKVMEAVGRTKSGAPKKWTPSICRKLVRLQTCTQLPDDVLLELLNAYVDTGSESRNGPFKYQGLLLPF